MRLSPNRSSATFTLANGATILTAASGPSPGGHPTQTGTGTITGGAGIFGSATVGFQYAVTEDAQAKTTTLTGSGMIDAPNATGVTALPSSLQLQAPQGSGATVSNSLILSNHGLAAVPFTASTVVTSKSDWLSVSSPSGTVPAGSPFSVQVTANPSELALGVYEGRRTARYNHKADRVLLSVPRAHSGPNAPSPLRLS